MVRSMMSFTDLPSSFWGHALETAVYTINRILSKFVNKILYKLLTKQKPNLHYLKN